MKLNKQQKVYVGVLAVTFVGLLTDRFIIGTGQSGPSAMQASMVLELAPDSTKTIHAVLGELSQPKKIPSSRTALSGESEAWTML